MSIAATVSPVEAGSATCVDAGHEHDIREGLEWDYTWYKATAKRASIKWAFKRWEWVYHIEETFAGGTPQETTRTVTSTQNPLERYNAFDFGVTTYGRPQEYMIRSWVTDLVAVFEERHHIGSGWPVYNKDGTLRCKADGVAYDSTF